MIVRVLGLVVLVGLGTTAWAQGGDSGGDGAAQRIPFSREARGTRQLEPLPAPSPLPEVPELKIEPIKPLKPIEFEPIKIEPIKIEPIKIEPIKPIKAGPTSPWQELDPQPLTLEQEVGKIVDGMREALDALLRTPHDPDDARLQRMLETSRDVFSPGAPALREYLGPEQNALTEAELEETNTAFRRMFERALESDDPRDYLGRMQEVLARPNFVPDAVAHTLQQRENTVFGNQINSAANDARSGPSHAGDGGDAEPYASYPILLGYPDHVMEPNTGQIFRKVGDYYVPVPDPR